MTLNSFDLFMIADEDITLPFCIVSLRSGILSAFFVRGQINVCLLKTIYQNILQASAMRTVHIHFGITYIQTIPVEIIEKVY